MRTRVKICGITRSQDGIAATKVGADAIGMVFYEKSPRRVSIEAAQDIVADMPPFVSIVGLFVDPSPKFVASVLHRVPLDLLQFHGNELPEECSCYGKPYIKAISMKPGIDVKLEASRFVSARGLLLDTFSPDIPGGTGEKFDWTLIPDEMRHKIILAGGLTEKNVWKVITTVSPYAIDVSSGVEIEKGVKDYQKMVAFMRSVNSV
ncbi:MAG: phosphoribosylanthranilate isomerase [Thiohalomonadales bacterium]